MRPARRAMLAMMETGGKDHFAHPMFWAPSSFVLRQAQDEATGSG